MTAQVLERLKSEAFALSAGFLSTAGSLRRFLRTTEEVAAVRASLGQGAITDATLRSFVSDLMGDFRRGERFVHELALAALAVVLETRPTAFAEEFLHDLSRLQLAEMSLCIRVARECLQRRVSVIRNAGKVFDLKMVDQSAPVRYSLGVSPRTCSHDALSASHADRLGEPV